MRILALLLCVSLAAAETIEEVQSFLAGDRSSYPGLGDPAVRTASLPLILAALDGPHESRTRAWGLVGNLGPRAFPIRDGVIAAFRRAAKDERPFGPASAIGRLGPLAEPLLPEILAAPDHLGLDWPAVLRIQPDPTGLVPRLVQDTWSADRATVIAAAQGLEAIAWCPAVVAAVPALEQALANWPVAPPLGPAQEAFAVSWQSETDDPDSAEIFDRRVNHATPPDPWPALLAMLAEITPSSIAAREAARSELTAQATAERRQAALRALSLLDIADRRALATAVAPWLGPGPRGRSGLSVFSRLGTDGLEALERLPPDARDGIIASLARRAGEETGPLPTGWAAPLIAATKRPSISTARTIARCGSAGAEYLLTEPNARNARFAITSDLVAPVQEPAGLADALAATAVDLRAAGVAMIEAWWYAPWARALAAQRRDGAADACMLRLTALAAADGDAAALAWLRADPGRLRALLDDPPWQLRDRPGLLPADLAAPLASTMARRRAQNREFIAQHRPDEMRDLPPDPATAETLLLARLRYGGGEAVQLWFLDHQRHTEEAGHALTRRLCQQPLNQVSWFLAEHPLRLRSVDRERYLRHPDPLVRRMAADW